jgi:hypothetical protein
MALQQSLFDKVLYALIRDTGEDEVLVCGKTDLTVAVYLGESCRLDKVRSGKAPDRDRTSHIGKTLLTLGMYAHVVAAIALGQLLAGRS